MNEQQPTFNIEEDAENVIRELTEEELQFMEVIGGAKGPIFEA